MRLVVAGQLLEKPDEGVEALRFVEQVGAMAGDHELFVFRQGAAGQDDRWDRLQLRLFAQTLQDIETRPVAR